MSRHKPRFFRPHLECLEDRVTPSVTVTTTLDPTTPIAGQVSLREAINMVNAGQVADNTIILPAGTYQNVQGTLNVMHSLNLQGAGAGATIIDGGGTRSVIDICPLAAVNVQISGVTVRDGKSDGFGGGISMEDMVGQSSTLRVMNSIITANKGGGIFANNGDIIVNNSQVTDNQSGGFFGGIGDSNLGASNISVIDSLIAGNTASLSGAGISIANGGHGAVTIRGSTIRDNTVTTNRFGGGGIFAVTTGDIAISNSTIEGNTSLNDGGGLEVQGFDGQSSGPANIVFSNDTIDNNQSTQGNGGGIAIETASNVSLQNTTLSGNSAAEAGGAMFLNTNVLTATLQGSTISGNTGGAFGGGIEDQALTLMATNSSFSNNSVSNGDGGGIDVENGANQTVNLTNVTVNGNQAKGSLGFGFGGGMYDSSNGSSVTLVSCLLANNTAATLGGAIEQAEGALTVQTSQFTGNVAANSGGALDFAAETALTISDSTFNNNQSGLSGGALDYRTGGAGSSLTNDTFTGNTAVGDGGAIVILNGTLGLVIDSINANKAGGNGGGVNDNSSGTQSFQNCIVAGNTAAGIGPDVFTAVFSTGPIITDLGGNFIGTLSGNTGFGDGTLTGNPLLGPLQNNGGIVAGAPGDQQVVQTEALLPGSTALGKGVPNGAPMTDERGFLRLTPPDIGAFQFQNAALTVAITTATPTVTINGSDSFTITVTNTSGNALPADNSTLTVALSGGLTTTGPLTFTLTALAAGQSQSFTITTTATVLGTQTVTVTVTSPDTAPNSITASSTITVVMPPMPTTTTSTTTHTPTSSLTLFAFGFGPTGIDLFEVDNAGDIFAVPLMGGGPIFLNTELQLPLALVADGQLLALLADSNGQVFLIDIISPFSPLIEPAVLAALKL